jgi:hypothetical protein
MADTHDYETRVIPVSALTDADTLVGESGGLSAVYEVRDTGAFPGFILVATEHGTLLVDPDRDVEVYAG